MSRPLILYHANCADGFASAWIAHRKFGDEADYLAVNYGEDPPDVAGRNVYVLDFCYPKAVLQSMAKVATQILILDHHKTAKADLDNLVAEYDGSTPSTRLVFRFDLTKSGGRMTWEHFFRKQPVPWLVKFTEDRDLWKWKLPNSKEVSAVLAAYPREFDRWDKWGATDEPPLEFVAAGRAILQYQAQVVETACANAVEIDLDGHKVLATNATVLISETAGKLAEGRPFGATFFIRSSDGKKVWSLRSAPDGLDVSEIAKRHGGGGHRSAAGFEEAA